MIQVVGEEESEVMRSFEDDDDEEFGTIWTGIEIVRDTPLPYSAKLYEPKPQPRLSLRTAWEAAVAEAPMVPRDGPVPRVRIHTCVLNHLLCIVAAPYGIVLHVCMAAG